MARCFMPGGEKHDREDIWQFVWRGEYHTVEDGTEMLVTLCNFLLAEQPQRFEELPDAFPSTRKRWFTRSGIGLARGHRFPHTHVWRDTNMSSARKKSFAKELLRFFGHAAEEIRFNSSKTTKR